MASDPPAPNDNKIVTFHAAPHDDWHAIILHGANDGTFKLTDTDDPTITIALCRNAKRLAKFAWDNGAISIKHAYNLKLAE